MMLDLGKKYYVSVGGHLKSVIESWASENSMKLVGEEMALPTCGRVYELDVQHNEKLLLASRLLGSGHPNFLNGRRVIGHVAYDNSMGEMRAVVFPAIRDR